MRRFISIYRSPKREGMYIYLEKETGPQQLPEGLTALFGTPVLVTHMMVGDNKQFAKFNAQDLFRAITDKGFYLQMPEPIPEYKKYLVKQNDKLS